MKKEKIVREPILVLENKLVEIKGTKLYLSFKIFEPFPDKEGTEPKKHKKVGYGSILINELINVNGINVFLNVAENEYWLALPNKSVKGKWVSIIYIEKDDMVLVNNSINEKQVEEQVSDEIWERDL